MVVIFHEVITVSIFLAQQITTKIDLRCSELETRAWSAALLPDFAGDPRSADVSWHADVKLVRHGLSLDEAVLTQMIAMVRRVDEVGVIKLADPLQLHAQLKAQQYQM